MATFAVDITGSSATWAELSASFVGGNVYAYDRRLKVTIKQGTSTVSTQYFVNRYTSEEGKNSVWYSQFAKNLSANTSYSYTAVVQYCGTYTPSESDWHDSGYTDSGTFTTYQYGVTLEFDSDGGDPEEVDPLAGGNATGSLVYITLPTAPDPPSSSYTFGGWRGLWSGAGTYNAATRYGWTSSNTDVHYTFIAVWSSGPTPTTGITIWIDNGSSWDQYYAYIDNGTSWDLYTPQIDNGSTWD